MIVKCILKNEKAEYYGIKKDNFIKLYVKKGNKIVKKKGNFTTFKVDNFEKIEDIRPTTKKEFYGDYEIIEL